MGCRGLSCFLSWHACGFTDDVKTGYCILTIDHHTEPVTTASWAPDGESFVTGSLGRQSQLCLWNLHGRSVYSWATNYRIQDCEISPDGQRLVTISPNQQIFVYNFVTREEEHSINLKSKMTCISISRDSRYMLINMTDNEIQLVDIETAQIVQRYEGQKQGGFVIRSAFGGADENLVISGSEGKSSISHQTFQMLISTFSQIPKSIYGKRRMARSSRLSRATTAGVSMECRGIRQIHACSLLQAMTEKFECESSSFFLFSFFFRVIYSVPNLYPERQKDGRKKE